MHGRLGVASQVEASSIYESTPYYRKAPKRRRRRSAGPSEAVFVAQLVAWIPKQEAISGASYRALLVPSLGRVIDPLNP